MKGTRINRGESSGLWFTELSMQLKNQVDTQLGNTFFCSQYQHLLLYYICNVKFHSQTSHLERSVNGLNVIPVRTDLSEGNGGATARTFNMESRTTLMFVLSLLQLAIILQPSSANAYLPTDGCYAQTCPQATTIVKNMVNKIIMDNRNIAGGLLRLHFHDCFVRGCDASVLLDSPTNTAEKDAVPNANSLRGFKEIEEIKAAVEAECPGVVSCADILALAARDAVVEVGGRSWSVALGRKDGHVSLKSEADEKTPSPFDSFHALVQNFAAVGLNQQEMVVLSGGHTIGRASCGAVQQRLYNFGGVSGVTDPSIDSKLANELKQKCPQNQQGSELSMDASKNTFDNLYFKAVLANKGLFESDANLLTNPVGLELVTRYSKPGSSFYTDFAAAMLKRSNIQWSTEGEIRRVCSAVN